MLSASVNAFFDDHPVLLGLAAILIGSIFLWQAFSMNTEERRSHARTWSLLGRVLRLLPLSVERALYVLCGAVLLVTGLVHALGVLEGP